MKKTLFFAIAITIFISFIKLGSVLLFDVDEAVFSQSTREMVEGGRWITPTYNGENRYDKPILFYWLMAFSFKIFGINEFAARLPSAVSGILLCLTVYLFVRRFYDEETAFYSAISLSLSIFFFVYSHAAVTDMVLTLFSTISIFSFYLSIKSDRRYIYGFYIFSALAFLTKGLIGIIFPFGTAIIYLIFTEGLKGLKKSFTLKGWILFLIIAAPWYIAQSIINGQEFLDQFFIKHHFKRYFDIISGHKGPVYYYIPVLIIGLFPWIAFLPAGMGNFLKDFRNRKISLSFNTSLSLLAFIWLSLIFIFFSFSTTKLPNYILPAIPAVSILISSGMIKQNRLTHFANYFISAFSLMIGISFLISQKYIIKLGISDVKWTYTAAIIMLAMSILSLYALLKKKMLYGYMSALMISFLLVLSINAFPLANNYLQGTLYKYSLYVKNNLPDNEKILTYRMNNPSIVFYSGHKTINARDKDELLPYISDRRNLIAITKIKYIEVLKDFGFNLLEEDGKYAILERK